MPNKANSDDRAVSRLRNAYDPRATTDRVTTDAVNVVVKMPSAMGDKYPGELPKS